MEILKISMIQIIYPSLSKIFLPPNNFSISFLELPISLSLKQAKVAVYTIIDWKFSQNSRFYLVLRR